MQGFAERAREERARRAEEAHTAALEGATTAFEAERERALRRADAHAAALEGAMNALAGCGADFVAMM